MPKNEKDEPILILKFNDQEEMQKFFEVWKETEFGNIVKQSSKGDRNYKGKTKKDKKRTLWSKYGLENLDNKNSEKPSLI
jgi:hypothetical protein